MSPVPASDPYRPVADAILTALTKTAPPSGAGGGGEVMVPETTRVVFPLPEGTWVRTSPFGWRTDPITFDTAFHSGSDYGAADGTPIFAVAAGIVTHAGYTGNWGGLIII